MSNSTNVKFIQLLHVATTESGHGYFCALASDGSIWFSSLSSDEMHLDWMEVKVPFKDTPDPAPETPAPVSPPLYVASYDSVKSQSRRPVLMFLHESYPNGKPSIGVTPLYGKYIAWCRKNKEARVSINMFGRIMRKVPGVSSWKLQGLIHYGIKPLTAFVDWRAIDTEIQCHPSS